jgi:hypothetical protein
LRDCQFLLQPGNLLLFALAKEFRLFQQILVPDDLSNAGI